MDYKKEIRERGLKHWFVADKIGLNQKTLTVYLNDKNRMPVKVEEKLKQFLA